MITKHGAGGCCKVCDGTGDGSDETAVGGVV